MKDFQDIHIACVLLDPTQTFFALCGQGLQDQAHDIGIALTIRPAYETTEQLAAFLDSLRQPRVDAVILAGVEVTLTQADGTPRIPVVNCNGALRGMVPACNLQPNLRQAAELAARYLAECLYGQGKIVHIQGPLNNEIATLPRSHGFADVLAQYPGMAIVFAAEGQWSWSSGTQIMRAALDAHPDVQGVFAHNDAMALGALEVLEAAGRTDVLVVGVDAIPEALTAIHTGRMAATLASSPYMLGRTALTHAVAILQGQPTPATVLTDVQLITAETLIDGMLETVRVLPNVLRDLVAGSKAQQQLQDEIIATQRRLIQELSTPIIPVSDSVLIVPLIGTIDSLRGAQITEALVEAVRHQGAEVLIIDITGVAVVDTHVIHHLVQVTRAVRLLGAQVLLVGIGPEVAQTMVQLGVDLSGIVTRSTLQAGLQYVATKVGR